MSMIFFSILFNNEQPWGFNYYLWGKGTQGPGRSLQQVSQFAEAELEDKAGAPWVLKGHSFSPSHAQGGNCLYHKQTPFLLMPAFC